MRKHQLKYIYYFYKCLNMYYNTCMKKQLSIIVFIAFLSCFSLFAQEYFFDNYVYQSWNAFGTLNGTSATDIIQSTSSASRTPFVFASVPKASSRLFVGVPFRRKLRSE